MLRFLLFLCAVLFLLSALVPATARAQSATLQQAAAKLQAGAFAEAATLLEQVTASTPENARAWLMLGNARQNNQDLAGAQTAYLEAVKFPQTEAPALYNLGLNHALQGDPDEAFAALRRARDTRRFNLTGLDLDARAASLKGDPRYQELFPSADAFADAFVEPARIIQEWRGEAIGDQFGWIARNIGDVDGDGVNDVTTSAPTNAEGGQNAGKVYAYSGRTGALLWTQTGEAGAQLGIGIEAAGDVNADGIPDVVAGAVGTDQAFVYSGKDGKALLTLKGEASGDAFGRRVSDLGDIDGDGHDDVLIGAPVNGAAGQGAGSAYVYSGKDGSLLLTLRGESAGDAFGSAAGGWSDGERSLLVVGAPNAGPTGGGRTYVYRGLTEEPAFVIEADDTGAQLGGMFVSVVGDVDADGMPDVYASDWANRALGPSTGRIYIHSGSDGRRLMTLTGEAPGDGFGIGVADAGDLDHDGHADLTIGAWQHAGAAPSGGKVYLYSGKDGTLMYAITGKVPGETFGFDATGMGDVDGDGVADLLLTSAWSAIHGSRSGRMFIVSGAAPHK